MSNLISVTVKFEDERYNYTTSVNGNCSDKDIRDYFVGIKGINLSQYRDGGYKDNFQQCIDVEINR